MSEEKSKALFLSAGLRPRPKHSTREDYKIISREKRRTDEERPDDLRGVWFLFLTEELASRDLCVPVYMKKKKKKLMFLYKLQPTSHGTL